MLILIVSVQLVEEGSAGCEAQVVLIAFVNSFFLREGLSKKIEIENKCQTHSSFLGMNNRKLVLVKNSLKKNHFKNTQLKITNQIGSNIAHQPPLLNFTKVKNLYIGYKYVFI